MRLGLTVTIVLAVAVSALPAKSNHCRSDLDTSNGGSTNNTSNSNCSSSRQCMTNMVTKILDSMVAHNPDALPLAKVYRATEEKEEHVRLDWSPLEAELKPCEAESSRK